VAGGKSEAIAIAVPTSAGAWDYHHWLTSNAVSGSAGTVLPGKLNVVGNATANNLSGTNTGDQSIGIAAGTGISVSGSPLTGSGTMTVSATGAITAGTNITVNGSFPTVTVNATSSGGTITSLQVVSNAAAYSVTPSSAITSSGIYSIVPTGTSSQFVKADGSKDGTTYLSSAVTSIKMVSNIAAYTVTPTSTTTSTGVYSLVSTGTSSQFAKGDGSLDGTTYLSSAVTSIGLVAGSNISITGSSPITSTGTWTVTSTPPGSSTNMVYNNGGAWAASSNVLIGSADNNMLLATGIYTTAVTSPSGGNVKIYGSSINGEDEIWSANSSGVDLALQTDMGAHQYGQLSTNGTAIQTTGHFVSAISNAGTSTFNLRTYDATNLAPNLMYNKLTGTASANNQVELWYGFTGRDAMIGNAAFGAGSKITFDVVFPAYVSTQRIFVGYTSTFGQISSTVDPSAILNIIGIGKDAADATLQFMFNNGSGTATKVNTGITPTVNDEYLITIELPSNTTSSTVTIERRTKTASTKNSATNSAKIPTAGTLMYWHVVSNSAAISTAPVVGIKQVFEQLYGY
jgi:hypothetical protein